MNAYKRRNSGFSLIELMVVVVIVGILAAVAIPGYRSYVIRTNRAAARSCMLETAQFMERFYTTNPLGLTYVGAAPALSCQNDGNLNTRYTLTVDTLAQSTYRILATPIGAQATGDAACGTLRLDQAGARTISASTAAAQVNQCWSR